MSSTLFDYIIIGGGIVGVSTAWQLQQRHPDKRILLIEKEPELAQHQTGHNSGVIHAGVYYEPGSLKAQFCTEGVSATRMFCDRHNIPVENCGKLLVATDAVEHDRMLKLYQRCETNGVPVELLDSEQLRKIEPNIKGAGAIRVSTTSIVDYRRVTEKMAEEFIALGGMVQLNATVIGLSESEQKVAVQCLHGEKPVSFDSQYLITCSGLMADRMTKMLNIPTDFQIIPYRGEYYRLAKRHNQVVNHLIYPVPNPNLPFLGVHLTRMIDGTVTVGPNAVQGWKREGYGRINISLRDVWDMVTFSGFWKVTLKHLATGLQETWDSWWKAGYLKRVNKYCDHITMDDLKPYPAGIRAQAVMKDGSLVHDFLFAQSSRSLHVCNAPSPAATSAIPIGNYICEKVAEKLND